jgi:hypothetical protein
LGLTLKYSSSEIDFDDFRGGEAYRGKVLQIEPKEHREQSQHTRMNCYRHSPDLSRIIRIVMRGEQASPLISRQGFPLRLDLSYHTIIATNHMYYYGQTEFREDGREISIIGCIAREDALPRQSADIAVRQICSRQLHRI